MNYLIKMRYSLLIKDNLFISKYLISLENRRENDNYFGPTRKNPLQEYEIKKVVNGPEFDLDKQDLNNIP